MIVTDPKGEIYEENAEMLKAKGYNIILLIIFYVFCVCVSFFFFF